MSKLVSVIVPVYNTKAYLDKCVNSILNQTFTDFELLLVDDGSTDGSGEKLDEYALKDARVRVFHKPNGGSSSARNLAIKEAEGEYLSFQDSDDYCDEDFLESLTAPILEARAEGKKAPLIVQVGRSEIDESGERLPDICTPPEKREDISSRDFFKSLILHIGDCSFCTKVIHKDLFKNRAFPEGKLNEDFRLLIDMLSEVDTVVSLPGYKYHVFYRSGSNSRVKGKDEFSRVFRDNVENADYVEEVVSERYPDLAKTAIRFGLFQRMDYLLHIPISLMNKNNLEYVSVVKYVRKYFPSFWSNKDLTGKNKVYLTLFAIMPKGIRKIHAQMKGFNRKKKVDIRKR